MSLLHIGNKIDKQSAELLKDSITAIFDSASKNRMDQSTVVKALEVLTQVFEIKNVTISNSTFSG
jgi:hypothetical protein